MRALLSLAALTCCLHVAVNAAAQPPPPPPPPPPPADQAAPPPPPPPAAAPAPAEGAPPAQAVPPPPPPVAPGPAVQPPPPGPPPPAPPPADAVAVGAGAETHDGFYLRLALGGGYMNMNRDTEGEIRTVGTDVSGSSRIGGGGTAFELSIGGTPGEGLVLAGTLFGQSIPNAVVESDVANVADLELNEPLNFALIGITLDWYPNAAGGFHFGGTLGFAAAVARRPEADAFENLGGGGGALSLLVGYDWWIADEWSLGALLRFTGAALHGEETVTIGGQEFTGKEDDSLGAFTLMFSALHH